ncbi:MAG: HD domain-containing protein [Candidatus Accumulibacter sp.]|jgi:phosphoribosyl 1,2-cyclic phosphodiesterase|nr:HD domain-containing protein [Accumulibacter sp.]
MEIILHGVRGGIGANAPETFFYGANTACIELTPEGGPLVFLDAGTGLREAGKKLPTSGEAHLFLSHGHVDHVIGLWYFPPLHSPAWTTHLYLPEWLEPFPDYFYRCGLFPVPFDQLEGKVVRHTIRDGESVDLSPETGRVTVEAFATNHPGGNFGYRVRADNAVFVYSGDHEIIGEAGIEAAAVMLAGAALAVVDAQFGRADHRFGLGHSAWEDWAAAAEKAGVRRLVLAHHAPECKDMELDKLDKSLRDPYGRLQIVVGREGNRFTLGSGHPVRRRSDRLFRFLEELADYRDTNALLDRILTEARKITQADAGTIFLAEGSELVFAYTHNDSLFSADEAFRYAYLSLRVPISEKSIAGYVASIGRSLNLPDVRALPAGVPYVFNEDYDRQTGYVTRSALTLPFLDSRRRVLGVMQLINSLGPGKTPCAFTSDMEQDCRMLAWEVSGILARSEMEKNGIYAILRMAAVHDPTETSAHAERVGAVAAELYHVWAARRGKDQETIRREKGRMRLAAMLHDIGKVGISDLILKKPGKLTDEEFHVMRGHTALGASILADDPGDVARLAREIALHHHQKWNGQGYAGSGDEGRLAGDDIPLSARFTALADVFDALVSRRCYKAPWAFEKAMGFLQEEAHRHFDPALVECMLEIDDLIRSIYARFPDKE